MYTQQQRQTVMNYANWLGGMLACVLLDHYLMNRAQCG